MNNPLCAFFQGQKQILRLRLGMTDYSSENI